MLIVLDELAPDQRESLVGDLLGLFSKRDGVHNKATGVSVRHWQHLLDTGLARQSEDIDTFYLTDRGVDELAKWMQERGLAARRVHLP